MRRCLTAVGLLSLLAVIPLALANADKKETAGKGHFLEVGKSYGFTFVHGRPALAWGTVVEEPRDGWVRVVMSYGGVKPQEIPSWVNLQTVAVIDHPTPNPKP